MRLRVVDEVIDVPDELSARVERAIVDPFIDKAGRAPSLHLTLAPAVDAGTPLILDGNELGVVKATEGQLAFSLRDAPFAALGALRLGWYASVVRQGGLLIHSSSVVFRGGAAVLAAGPSGSGKSTLARLCCEAAKATLLSDEIVALLPGGRVCGSPFFSDYREAGSPLTSKLAVALRLRKEAAERLTDVDASELARLLISQTFRTNALALSAAEVLRRIGRGLEGVRTAEFGFRKDPAAAHFLERNV